MDKIKIGFAPTRRSIFSAPDAVKYRKLTAKRLQELKIDFVDITDINEEGLLYCDEDRLKIAEKFKQERVDGLFLPHCNFGTEYECVRLAKELNVPVLLWGPLDERPEADGTRLRDTQCGLFATGKVLRRFQVPFTYMTNCRLNDPVFERGVRDFLAVCNVVKRFQNIRILQISTRPFDFWTTMCNEGELLEKFNIQLAPVPMPELTDAIRKAKEEGTQVEETIKYCREKMEILVDDTVPKSVTALKVAMKRLINQYGCQAAAIQCWNQLQSEIGIMPCAANSLLNEEGIPVVCETDIHGAITSLLTEAAGMGETRTFFADWTIRHPDVENGELLQHCYKMEIYKNVIQAVKNLVEKAQIHKNQIKVLGISNQRETAVVWNRFTGEPVCHAVVWQCGRGAAVCEGLKKDGYAEMIRQHTGLQLSPYFSAAKIAWVFRNVEGARKEAEKGSVPNYLM